MDLVAGVRKEGSRGGRAEFKWEDVRDSQHRENYLGHSLMAPVGRWQKGKDLNWYAKGDNSAAALSAAEARKEEIRKIKESEESALSEALGYGPTIKSNANDTPIGRREVEKAIKETAEGDEEEGAKGVGFGGFEGRGPIKEEREVLEGEGLIGEVEAGARERRKEADGAEWRRRRRSRSRIKDGIEDRRHRRRTHRDEKSHCRHRSRERSRRRHRDRSRDRSRDRYHSKRERSRSHERRRDDDRYTSTQQRERSYSPDHYKRRGHSRERQFDHRR
ncbi:hypothetical protein MMC21_004822 [Puttea exsequens]|nr:hypothetical protein [Puttea exsequens]